MLFGSVPSPPRKPRSSTSTQSARHNTAAPTTAKSTSRGRPLSSPTPTAPSASTTNRLTAQPWAASKDPNEPTHEPKNPG